MEFIEATLFTKYVYSYLTDDEYSGLQSYLLQFPESGKVVPGSGGVRKLRWAMTGTGTRMCAERARWCSSDLLLLPAHFVFKKKDDEIWLLTIYSKSETENIPAHILRKIAEEIQNV